MLSDYLETILKSCAEEFDVEVEQVKSCSKRQELVYCRKAYCLVAYERLDIKRAIIGIPIGISGKGVSKAIISQPQNRYYAACLSRIRSKVPPFS